jgi:hypothetical protein
MGSASRLYDDKQVDSEKITEWLVEECHTAGEHTLAILTGGDRIISIGSALAILGVSLAVGSHRGLPLNGTTIRSINPRNIHVVSA